MKRNEQASIHCIMSLIFLPMMLLFVLTACGNKSTPEDVSATDVPVNLPQYTCEEANESVANVSVQLDINPSFILGMTADGIVMSIEANNEDAEDVMVNCLGNYFDGVVGGVELEYVIRDIGEAVRQGGYIEDTLDVSVTVLSGNMEGDTLEKAFEQATAYLADDDGITASFELLSDHNEDAPEGQPENEEPEEDRTCDLCGGEGTMVCDLCNGEGSIIEIEEREVEVRNDYVCPYCGGSGILDDGMHGGETAVCGHCGGDGATGPMSGDFRENAFDIVTVEEEVTRPCSRCNGSGILDCPHCEGTGIIE